MYPDARVVASYRVDLEGLPALANTLIGVGAGIRVWLIFGEMGSGKTTLIKALCAALGVTHTVSSPSFSIVNEYPLGDEKVYHFDFYRIRSEQEAYDIGTEEYFYSGAYCFVEWPEKIPSLIPARHVAVSITAGDYDERTIAISIHDGEAETRF
ncbi:MAG TPA: tRNA (adenosine(37)-N6)-threonylcarbamoyltransferase complex ATPase subunit type 1 TsaE [Cyclobacteriaceae bacterium]